MMQLNAIQNNSPKIGMLREKSLHRSLINRYRNPSDLVEQKLDGFVIDIIRDKLLIEIQTGSFSSIRSKLAKLLPNYKVLLIYPIPKIKWIVRTDKENNEISRRKSPKRGRVEQLFKQLVYMPKIMNDKNFSIEVAIIEAEELWRDDGKGSWRRKKWSIADRRLVTIFEQLRFDSPSDFLNLLPQNSSNHFTNKSLAVDLKLDYKTTQNMTYCLKHLGLIKVAEKKGNSYVYTRTD